MKNKPPRSREFPICDVQGLFFNGVSLPLAEIAHMTPVKPEKLLESYLTRQNGFTERGGVWSYSPLLEMVERGKIVAESPADPTGSRAGEGGGSDGGSGPLVACDPRGPVVPVGAEDPGQAANKKPAGSIGPGGQRLLFATEFTDQETATP